MSRFLKPTFKPRLYQELIAASAISKNTLCILPTGMGKTFVAILVAAYRLEKFPGKILMLAPTRPLVNQHLKTFEKYMNGEKDDFVSLTGKISSKNREVFYKSGKIFFATPQLIKNDIQNKRIDLKDFTLLIVDECHRSVKKYAYTTIVDEYVKTNPSGLILGLTASPGGIKDIIDEVKKNLHAENIEVRTEKDADVSPYIQETKIEKVYVEFPEDFNSIRENLEKIYNQKIYELLKEKVIPSPKISKKDLLSTQLLLGREYSKRRDWGLLKAVISCAQAIKIGHAIELIETQGISSLKQYFDKLGKDEKSSATKRLLSDPRLKKIIELTNKLYQTGTEHPKLEKVLEIVKEEIKRKKNTKIIIFANYRDTVSKIANLLERNWIEVREFYGQAKKGGKGMSQKEQIQTINEFELELFNVLVATSVAEEGLSIPAVDLVIFYEPVPSEIRTIQRRGRTGRTESGRVVFLITKGTRDEWYYWSAYHKERRMKGILKGLKEDKYKTKTPKTIKDFVS
ncbi:MAG: helicase-related protein [Candidatus Aenigmatarchaeota archaeon]